MSEVNPAEFHGVYDLIRANWQWFIGLVVSFLVTAYTLVTKNRPAYTRFKWIVSIGWAVGLIIIMFWHIVIGNTSVPYIREKFIELATEDVPPSFGIIAWQVERLDTLLWISQLFFCWFWFGLLIGLCLIVVNFIFEEQVEDSSE